MKAKMTLLLLLLVSTVCSAQEETQEPQDTIGIYIVTDDGLQRMLTLRNDGVGTADMGLSTFSHGFIKAKGGATFQGATSMYKFDHTATFRFYFGDLDEAEQNSERGMFYKDYSVRDFNVAKFKVKKKDNQRLLVNMKTATWTGSKIGIEPAKDVQKDITVLRDGVYEMTVTAEPGEYCIYFCNVAGAFMGVYDFTIN